MSAAKIRVAHYRTAFSILSETFLYDALLEQERAGVDCHVLTRNRVDPTGRPFTNVHLLPLPHRWAPSRLAYRLRGYVTRQRLDQHIVPLCRTAVRKLLRELAPDVVHSHFGEDGALVAPVAHALGIPHVVTFYGHDISRLPRRVSAGHHERMWPQLAAVTVLSEHMRHAAEALGCPPEKIHVIHLGKRMDEYPYEPRRRTVRKFVSVGRLTGKKGHDDAIRAISATRAAGHDVSLHIIGAGKDRARLDDLIRLEGAGEAVELVGPKPHDVVIEEMRGADAFLLCSRTAEDGDQEGTPTVLIEAQAMGLPVVATRHAGIPEMVPEEDRERLAPERDVEAIGQALIRLCGMGEPERLALTQRAREHVERHFNVCTEVPRMIDEVYKPVMDARARTAARAS